MKIPKNRQCRICDKKLIPYQKKFCSNECYILSISIPCLNCGKMSPKKYCSIPCRDKIKFHPIICQKCNKEFIIKDNWKCKNENPKYCSDECKRRKWDINSNYFDNLTQEKIITLGQLITTCHIVDYNTIIIQSDESTMLDISNKLESAYKSVPAQLGLIRQKIISHKLVVRLTELGFQKRYLFQDVPLLDGDLIESDKSLWEGLKLTHSYSLVDGVNVFKTERSKVALWVRDRFGGKSITNTYKDLTRGVMACEWIVFWK